MLFLLQLNQILGNTIGDFQFANVALLRLVYNLVKCGSYNFTCAVEFGLNSIYYISIINYL